MQIELLYFEDCPSHEVALERLRTLLAEEDIQATVTVIRVETEEQAQRLRFIGSPTILINGHDIDPPPSNTRYALTCRAYHLPDGHISPLPSVGMIRSALRHAT
jgi:hypothetical protein